MSLMVGAASLLLSSSRTISRRVNSPTHNIRNLLPAKGLSWKGPVVYGKSHPARLSARLPFFYGTISRYPDLGELDTRNPCSRQPHSCYPGRPNHDSLARMPDKLMKLRNVACTVIVFVRTGPSRSI